MAKSVLVLVAFLLITPSAFAGPSQAEAPSFTAWQAAYQQAVDWLFGWAPERIETQKNGAMIAVGGVQVDPEESDALTAPSELQVETEKNGAYIVPSGVAVSSDSGENLQHLELDTTGEHD